MCEDEVPELPEDEDILEDHGGRPSAHRDVHLIMLNMKWKLIHPTSVYSLTDSLTHSLICPHNALVSHLKLGPWFPGLSNIIVGLIVCVCVGLFVLVSLCLYVSALF